VHVAVQDAGTGFRKGTQHLVFEPFYTTKPSGMGMGLAISKSIIEAHGGLIWAGDNAFGGATLHFTLPVPRSRSDWAAGHGRRACPKPSGRRGPPFTVEIAAARPLWAT